MNQVEQELLDNLVARVGRGEVEILPKEESEGVTRKLEASFPFVGSKIAWGRVKHHLSESTQGGRKTIEAVARDLVARLNESALVGENEDVYIIGDSAVDSVLLMKWRAFRESIDIFVSLPQHTYVVDTGAHWCVALTIEGYADWGSL